MNPAATARRAGVALLLLLAWLLPVAPAAAAEPPGALEPLRIGVIPRRPPQVTRAMFAPLAAHLAKRLDRPVELDVPADFAAFWEQLENHAYDLVQLNPYQYARAHRTLGYTAILHNEEFGLGRIAGTLYVRNDSGITRVADLRGRKIIFGGGPDAMFSYIAATALLREHGLAEGDYLVQFTTHPVQAAVALYYGQGAAAGLGDAVHRMPTVQNQIDVSELRRLAQGPSLTHLPWAVSERLAPELAARLADLMLGLNHTPQGRSLLRTAGLSAVRRAHDQDYDPHRRLIRSVTGEDY